MGATHLSQPKTASKSLPDGGWHYLRGLYLRGLSLALNPLEPPSQWRGGIRENSELRRCDHRKSCDFRYADGETTRMVGGTN
jgi:hypothetical protein